MTHAPAQLAGRHSVRGVALLFVIGLVAACDEPPAPLPQVAGAVAVAEFAVIGDWPNYNRDLAGTRHSPLTQIDTINVSDLRQAWVYALGSVGASQADPGLTPLVVGGVLYATAAGRVVALRADTGEELWRYSLEQGAPVHRGLAYWTGRGAEASRLFFIAGRRLIALEASSGRRIVTFGAEGAIELPASYDAAPTRFENLLIVGFEGVDQMQTVATVHGNRPRDLAGVPGHTDQHAAPFGLPLELAALAGGTLKVRIGTGRAQIGGGTLPRSALPSVTIEVSHPTLGPQELAARLREQPEPVIAYVGRGSLKLDLRTIFPHQDASVIRALMAAT